MLVKESADVAVGYMGVELKVGCMFGCFAHAIVTPCETNAAMRRRQPATRPSRERDLAFYCHHVQRTSGLEPHQYS